eukprot:25759-Eustigmatos_ZCMA.PRE.1
MCRYRRDTAQVHAIWKKRTDKKHGPAAPRSNGPGNQGLGSEKSTLLLYSLSHTCLLCSQLVAVPRGQPHFSSHTQLRCSLI